MSEAAPLFAAVNGFAKVDNVEMLLKLGADPNVGPLVGGRTVLDQAKAGGNKRVIEVLKAAGAR